MQTKRLKNGLDYLDPRFGSDRTGIVWIEKQQNDNNNADGITVDPDDRLLIAGGHQAQFSLVRLTPDGMQDTTFGASGVVTGEFESGYKSKGHHTTVLKSGEILLSGFFSLEEYSNELAFALFDTTGSPVQAFGQKGVTVIRPFESVTVKPPEEFQSGVSVASPDSFSSELPDGKLLVISNQQFSYTERAGLLIRLNRDGSIDKEFGAEKKGYVYIRHPEYPTWIGSMIPLENGMFAVAGNAMVNARTTALVAVYNADGTTFDGFGTNGFFLLNSIDEPSQISSLTLIDNNILGIGSTLGGLRGTLLVCLDAKGEPVKAFNGGEPVQTPVDDAPLGVQWLSGAVRKDGKIVAVGNTLGDQDSKTIIAQYLPDGQLDTNFGNERGLLRINLTDVLDMGTAIAIQKNSQIVVAGSSLPINGRRQGFVFRCLN